MKKLFTLILFLFSFIGFSQSGDGYINYTSWRTQCGNGCNIQTTINGTAVTVAGHMNNTLEFDAAMREYVGLSATEILNSGETQAFSAGGFGTSVLSYNGGRPIGPGNSQGEYYIVDYTGWFYASSTGNYKFWTYSDDSHEFWLDLDGDGVLESTEMITKKYNGSGNNQSTNISLTSGTWYKLRVRFHEFTGGDWLRVQYQDPTHNGGSTTSSWRILGDTTWGDKVSNAEPAPTFVNTVANDGPNAIIYKSFKINDYANNNNQGEYNDHPQSSSDFDAMFDYANKNTTTWTHYGRDTATKAFTWPYPNLLPKHDNTNFGWIIEGYFVPPTSGTYKFQLNSDDRSDFWFDANDDGTITNTGIGLGNGAREIDITNLTAGVSYKFRVRFEQGAGGANLTLKWKSPEDIAAGAAFAFNGNTIYSIDADNYVEPFHYDVNYKFRNIDETGFSINTYYEVSDSEIAKNSNSNTISLDGNGEATITSQVDEDLVGQGKYNITATPGNVEWVVTYMPMVTNKYTYRIGLDAREFPSNVDLDDVNNIELLDLVDTDGTSSYFGTPGYSNSWSVRSNDPNGWNEFNYMTWSTIPFSSSNYSSSIRSLGGGGYALKVDLNFNEVTAYKTQYVVFDSPTTSELEAMVDDVFTVADVVMAFNELAGGGINGGFKGDFDYNVQYANADVSRDGVFDFKDTQIMLDFLNGGTMFDASYLAAVMSLTEVSAYNSMTSTNWTNYGGTRTMFPLGLVTGTKQYDKSIAVHWKGDVNMSHSHLPSSVQVTSMARNMTISNSSKSIQNQFEVDLDIEKIGEEIVVTLKVPENTKNITGSEFRIGYDNSRVTFDRIENDSNLQSFSARRSTYIKLGSISSDGSQNLNGGTEYKIYFKETNNLDSFLGLVSVLNVELVKKDGTQIGVIVK